MAGSVWFNRFSVYPQLKLKQLRVVVEWSDEPQDLDTHLKEESGFHISHRNMKNYEDQAKLDRDDLDGQGPEIITLNNIDSVGRYMYLVHDFTNRKDRMSSKLSESRAHVRIYSPKGLVDSLVVPQNQQGQVWKVFVIEDGQITIVNELK